MTNVMTLVHDDDHPTGLNASVWQDREVIDCTRQSEYIPPLVCLLLGNNLKHQANKGFMLWSSDHEESPTDDDDGDGILSLPLLQKSTTC